MFDITAILGILHGAVKSNGVSYPAFGELLPLPDFARISPRLSTNDGQAGLSYSIQRE